MSSDGVLVLLHDDTLERTSNAFQVFPDRLPWNVYTFSMADINQLDFGSWFIDKDPFKQIAAGNIPSSDVEFYKNLQISTLEEALRFTKDNHWWVNVEIKDASGTIADAVIVSKVVTLIEELQMEEDVIISSFNHDYLRQVKSLNPDLAIGVLTSGPVMDPVALMRELDAQAYHPSYKVTDPKQVRLLREAGYDVNVWTVNDEKEMRSLIEMGVTGIITDYPQVLKPIIDNMN